MGISRASRVHGKCRFVKIYDDIEQGSEEWLKIRKGKVTASRLSQIITPKTGKLSASHEDLIDELLEEAYFPNMEQPKDTFWQRWGKDHESEARDVLAASLGVEITQVGFVTADIEPCGCSPDGLIYVEGDLVAGAEIKCPRPKTHRRYVREGILPDEYKAQVHGSMIFCNIDHWHFSSYVPGWKPFNLLITRDDFTKRLEDVLGEFLPKYKAAFIEVTNQETPAPGKAQSL